MLGKAHRWGWSLPLTHASGSGHFFWERPAPSALLTHKYLTHWAHFQLERVVISFVMGVKVMLAENSDL